MSYNMHHLEVLIGHLVSFNLLLFETSIMGFFLNMFKMDQNDEMEIFFRFLRYWGLQHNWNMRNACNN